MSWLNEEKECREIVMFWLSPSYQSPAPIRRLHVDPGHYPFPLLYIRAFHPLIHSRWEQDIWFSVQRHMYTAVSVCLKQLEESFNTTFNHAFVYVIKPKKTSLRTMLYCPQMQFDQICQHDGGPVFVQFPLRANAHALMTCRWYKSCAHCWRFQVCFSIHDSSLVENISVSDPRQAAQMTCCKDP